MDDKKPLAEVEAHPYGRSQEVVDYLQRMADMANEGKLVGFAVIGIRSDGTMWHHWDAAGIHQERLLGRMSLVQAHMQRDIVEELREYVLEPPTPPDTPA